ncbi:MAG: hypothetical protein LBJ87_09895 [bacterium]|nr:hypothetical protein [bacterium]
MILYQCYHFSTESVRTESAEESLTWLDRSCDAGLSQLAVDFPADPGRGG